MTDKEALARSVFGKDIEGFELDGTWLDRLDMGFDFEDILGDVPDTASPADGLVPQVADDLALELAGELAGTVPDFATVQPFAPGDDDAHLPGMPALLGAFAVGVQPSLEPTPLDTLEPELYAMVPQAPAMPAVPTAVYDAYAPAPAVVAAPAHAHDAYAASYAVPAPPAPTSSSRAAVAPAPRTATATRTPARSVMSRAAAAAAAVSGRLRIVRYGDAAGESLSRAERVARYRLKRKSRVFGKTIRYASRKAYAEVRPRIKGRFAKKEELEAWRAAEVAMRAGGGMHEAGHGHMLVVPVM